MAKLKKSGIRISLAAILLCAGLLGPGQAGKPLEIQAAGILDGQTAGGMDTGTAGAADMGAQSADAGMSQPAGPATVRAEAGIIEVESGFVDAKGTFWKMKSGSGFLIANKESATYIITNSSTVSNTPRKIKKYCKKHSIDTENMQLSNTIRVVITGDVMAEAEVVVKSAEKDYCVLSAANVVSQKESLKLGDSAGIAAGDLVYAYGFPKQTEDTIEYSEMDVRSVQGAVTQAEAYQEGGVYLAHSAPVMQGLEGGPLLDTAGYVIGLNCRQSEEDDTGTAYALPINEITAVLDNFEIYYGSRAIDDAYIQLTATYQECMNIQTAGGYKKSSMEALEQALEAAGEMLVEEQPHAADLQSATEALYAAKNALVPKTETITILIMIFAVLDLLLFVWMLIVAVKNAREKKKMELQRMQPSVQGGGYANAAHGSQAAVRQQMAQNAGYQRQQMAQNTGYQRQQMAQNAGYQQQSAQSVGYQEQQMAQNAGYERQQEAQTVGLRQPVQQEAERYRRPVAPPAGRRLRLTRQKTGQTVVLNKNQFIIGKSQSLADFCIADNQTVSRKHAMLFEDNGGWYIDDLNSLNGTCVNGAKVVPGQAVRLQSGDEISLSDEAFLVLD